MNILIVAVYEEMLNQIKEVKEKYCNMKIASYLCNTKDRSKLLEYLNVNHFDAIITRGGLYTFLKENTNFYIEDLGFSIYDLLNNIEISDMKNSVIVAFNNITNVAISLTDLTPLKINTITIKNNNEIENHVNEINKYKKIYCDTNTFYYLKELGYEPSLLKSSLDSISKSLNIVKTTLEEKEKQKYQEKILGCLLANENMNVYIYNDSYKLILSTHTNTIYKDEIEKTIIDNLDSLCMAKRKKIILLKDKYEIWIYNRSFFVDKMRYTSIKIEFHKRIIQNNYLLQDSNIIYTNYHLDIDILKDIPLYNENNMPIVIESEEGCGEFLYDYEFKKTSKYNQNAFLLDFKYISKKEFENLITKDYSLLNQDNGLIILKSIDTLSKNNIWNLFDFIKNSQLLKHNKLIIHTKPKQLDLEELFNNISYYYLTILPLRKNVNKINIINDHIKNLNLDSEYINLLYNYEYPENESELIKIIDMISVKKCSLEELSDYFKISKLKAIQNINLIDRSLEDIIYDVVAMNLKYNNYNQTKTSSKLEIGRTTLWRIINK